jgi:hypothetical protein
MTTINPPTAAVREAARLCLPDWRVLVVGDRRTPPDWSLEGVQFLSLREQRGSGSRFAHACPTDHYGRKNVGYLAAMQAGATIIAETDDDNAPQPAFFSRTTAWVAGRLPAPAPWVNAYAYFTDELVWPRGFPLDAIRAGGRQRATAPARAARALCPVQQHLVHGEPDVDAVYRLLFDARPTFRGEPLLLPEGSFCPFNSQATVWWPSAFPLLYLPCTASFRTTDIWRSLVAQRCLHATGATVAFLPPSLVQERNEHNILDDLTAELPGYRHNSEIANWLRTLELTGNAVADVCTCYRLLVERGVLDRKELGLLRLWLDEVAVAAARA